MSIEEGIFDKTKKALDANKDHPDFTSVFDDWKNNTSKKENQAELKLVNDAARGLLPNLTITDFTTDKAGKTFVVTLDEKTKTLQRRTLENFTPVDPRPLESDTKKDEDEKSNYQQPNKPETKPENVEVYAIKPGDNLWKIARHKLEEVNNANGKSGTKPSTIEVKALIDKIVAANQEGDGAIKDPNLIYTGKSLNIPIDKPATPPPSKDKPTDEKKGSDKTAPEITNNTNGETANKTPDTKADASKKNEKNGQSSDQTDLVPSVSLKFSADPNTRENPTIGGEEAAREAAVLKKYFTVMQNPFDRGSNNKELTATEITQFVAQCRTKTPGSIFAGVPEEDLKTLELAAGHIDRIGKTGYDGLLTMNGATVRDIDCFAKQEKDFEDRYQARFYLENFFSKISNGRDRLTVSEIRTYRESIGTNSSDAAELKAVDNLLAQLAKSKVTDFDALNKADAKAAISEKVDGSTYGVFRGSSSPSMHAPTP